MSAKAAEQTGTIHDIGYQPYKGGRTPPGRRFLVIARNVITVAWRQKGPKAGLYGALMVAVTGVVMMANLTRRGVPSPVMFDLVISQMVTGFQFCGFLLGLTVGCATIANDLKMGAFQFYFARPVRAVDYIRGKLLGLGLLLAVPLLAGPLVLALTRLTFAERLSDVPAMLPLVPRAILIGLVGTWGYMLPSAGIGALLERRVPAQALYVIYVWVIGSFAMLLAKVLHAPNIQVISAQRDVTVIAQHILHVYGDSDDPSWKAAAFGLAVTGALSYLAIRWRVRRAETEGLGAS
jgi:hypothetical protein